MRSPSVRLPLFAAAAIAGLFFVLVLADFSLSPRAALASHDGGADSFLIDMDPTGNAATSVGPIQDCARINKNGVQDADEDAVDTVFADIVANDIPADHPMIGFQVTVRHGSNLVITSAGYSYMLAAIPGSHGTGHMNQYNPEATTLLAYDIAGAPTAEAGSGVLTRIELWAATGGASLHALTLSNIAHVDSSGVGYRPDNGRINDGVDDWYLPSSFVAVNQACPPPPGPSDVAVTNLEIIVPASIHVNEQLSVQWIVTMANLGPSTASDYLVLGHLVTPYPWVVGCSLSPGSGLPSSGPPILSGGSLQVVSTFILDCSTPGTRVLSPSSAVVPFDVIDTDLTNNRFLPPPTTITVLPSDPDGDGVIGAADLCPGTLAGHPVDAAGCSDGQADGDGDGICSPGAPSGGPSACTGVDNCPSIPNPGQEDTDGDGTADACEPGPPIAVGGLMGLLDSAEMHPRSPGGETDSIPVPAVAAAAMAAIAVLSAIRLRRLRR